MNEIYLDIYLAVPPDEEVRELLPAALAELGFEGFEEDDRGIHCYINKAQWFGSIEHVIQELSKQFNLPFVELLSIKEIANKNWNEEWEKTIQPIQVTDQIIITPSWHPVNEKNKIVLTIDPKMTFGTGYHETTRLTLRLMERYVTANATVLDVGTGTGILAIAAIKLGAAHAVGIDIDEWTRDNGMENAERNGVAGDVEIIIGSLETVSGRSFNVIVANIIRNTILELMDDIISKLIPGGTILFSGLLVSDKASIEQAVAERGFSIAEVIQENEWIAMAVRHT